MEENYTHLKIEDKLFPPKITLNSRGKLLLLDDPWVMGIINITPNSFYSESRFSKENINSAVKRAESMVLSGAKIIDIGGYSSRPGADEVSEEDRKSTRLNSSHVRISYAVFCLKKKSTDNANIYTIRNTNQ